MCVYLKKKATSHLVLFCFLYCFCNLHKHLTNNKKKEEKLKKSRVKEKYFALVLAYIYIMCVACRHTLQWLTFSRILIFQKWSFETWVFLSFVFYVSCFFFIYFWFCLLDAWKINVFVYVVVVALHSPHQTVLWSGTEYLCEKPK